MTALYSQEYRAWSSFKLISGEIFSICAHRGNATGGSESSTIPTSAKIQNEII